MVILYQFYILVESIIFVLAGLIIAYVLANVIDYNIYQTQSELVAYLNRIAGKNVGDTSQNVFTFKDILKLFLAFIYSIAIISASALITTCKNLKSTFNLEMR